MSNNDKCGNKGRKCTASNKEGFIVPGESRDRRGELKLLVRGEDKAPVPSQTGLCLV